MSTKAEILAGWAFKEEAVSFPNGTSVLVREFTGADRDLWEQGLTRMVDGKREADLTNQRAKLVALCAVGSEGRLFPGADGWVEITTAPASWLQPLYEAALRVNGLNTTAVDDAEKNSEAAPSGASISV